MPQGGKRLRLRGSDSVKKRHRCERPVIYEGQYAPFNPFNDQVQVGHHETRLGTGEREKTTPPSPFRVDGERRREGRSRSFKLYRDQSSRTGSSGGFPRLLLQREFPNRNIVDYSCKATNLPTPVNRRDSAVNLTRAR